MVRMSAKWQAWWAAQPEAQTCRSCGTVETKSYVQPQYDTGSALCCECICAANEKWRTERKAQLAAAPRCEIPGCGKRSTYKVGHAKVGLCGRHMKVAKAAAARSIGDPGPMAYLFMFGGGPVWRREDVLKLAAGKEA